MKLRITLFLLLFVFFYSASYAQEKADSLKVIFQNERVADSVRFKAIDTFYDLYTYSQPEETLLITDYHYELAKEKNSVEQMVWALNGKGLIYSEKSEFERSKDYYEKAAVLAKDLDNKSIWATLQGNIGTIYRAQYKYLEATQKYVEALQIFQELKRKKGESRMLNNLGGIYQIIGNYDLALDYYDKSLTIFEKSGPKDRKIGILYLNIGSIKFIQEKYKESLGLHEKALSIFQHSKEPFFQGICYNEIARCYLKLDQIDKASTNIEKSIAIANETEGKVRIIHPMLTKAQITYETDPEEATKQAEALLPLLSDQKNKELIKDVYDLLYKGYKEQNKTSLSLEMYEIKTSYTDSIQKEKNNFALVREAVKNDFDRQLRENKIESEAAEEALKLKQKKSKYSIIGIGVVLIGLVVFFFQRRSIQNRKKRDGLLEELETLKNEKKSNLLVTTEKFELDRAKIQESIGRKLNETDWTVLTIILDDPVIPNKKIAEKAFMSVDGIGSSLRRMYEYFEIKDTKYKKISLLTDSIKRSNSA